MKKILTIGKHCVFIGCFLLVFSFINNIFLIANSDWRSKAFYENKDQVDILFLGSSHMYMSVLPMELWRNYGIVSVHFPHPCARNQEIYYCLREAIKTQKPKIVAIESLNFCKDASVAPTLEHLHVAFDKMRLSSNKIEMVKTLVHSYPESDIETVKSFYFPFLLYHSRWKGLQKRDFVHTEYSSKGAAIDYGCTNFAPTEGQSFLMRGEKMYKQDISVLDPIQLEYLFKIQKICQENDIKLLIITAPYILEFEGGTNKNPEKYLRGYNAIETVAQENHMDYINYLHKVQETNLNESVDFRDSGHLNMYGAEKVTKHLGQFLKENYDLPDRRFDPAYAHWNGDYEKYIHEKNSARLPSLTNTDKYLEVLSSDNDYVVSIASNVIQGVVPNVPDEMKSRLDEYGIGEMALAEGVPISAFIASRETAIGRRLDSADPLLSQMVDDVKFEVKGGVGGASVKIAGKESAKNAPGLNVVIYDRVTERIVDSCVIDTYNAGQLHR